MNKILQRLIDLRKALPEGNAVVITTDAYLGHYGVEISQPPPDLRRETLVMTCDRQSAEFFAFVYNNASMFWYLLNKAHELLGERTHLNPDAEERCLPGCGCCREIMKDAKAWCAKLEAINGR